MIVGNLQTVLGGGEHLDEDSEELVAFAAHALQKQRTRERRELAEDYSEPMEPYKQYRRERERESGHIGTSKFDIRDKVTSRQAVQRELQDWDAEDGDFDEVGETPRMTFEQAKKKFAGLFNFLDERGVTSPEVVEKYASITSRKGQLGYILNASLADRVALFCSENFDKRNYDNFIEKLEFHQDLINGRATRTVEEWDGRLGKYVLVEKKIDAADATKESIATGIGREALRSAMIGTPEYGAYRMALDINGDRDIPSDFPWISGYYSGVVEGRIGDWAEIIDEYNTIAKNVTKMRPDLDGDELEHVTVRKVAQIFAESMNYNDLGRGENSPYISNFHESVAWAQLGDGAKRQFRGMRQKIEGVDLRNIGRFLGRSGLSEKQASLMVECGKLRRRLYYIEDLSSEERQEFAEKENAFEINKQERWQQSELERIEHKYDKIISKTRSEERCNVYQERKEEEIQKLTADVAERVEYFSHRSVDELKSDIEAREAALEKKINKRKSVAEKAIDLHFALGVGEWDDDTEDWIKKPSVYRGCLDWINEAPFGVIKRAHKQLQEGVDEDEIYADAIMQTIQRVVSDPDYAQPRVKQMLEMMRDDGRVQGKLSAVTKLASKLGDYAGELTFAELSDMSSKGAWGIEDTLKVFSLDEARRLLDNKADLRIAPKVKTVAEEFGYDFDMDQLIKISRRTMVGSYAEAEGVFRNALLNFSFDEVQSIAESEMKLSDGSLLSLGDVSNVKTGLSRYGIVDVSDVLEYTAKMRDEYDLISGHYDDDDEEGHYSFREYISNFGSTVGLFGLKRATEFLESGVDSRAINLVASNFAEITQDNFEQTFELSKMVSRAIMRFGSFRRESRMVRFLHDKLGYNVQQLTEMYQEGVSASLYEDVMVYREGDEYREFVGGLDFSTKIKAMHDSRNRHIEANSTWDIGDAFKKRYSEEEIKQLVDRGLFIKDVYDVQNDLMRETEDEELRSFEIAVFTVENHLSPENIPRALRAGFNLEEIKLYPFLASSLLKVKGEDEA